MKTTEQTAQWMECGQGVLLHPATKNPVTTEVVEMEGFGRIFEVYHYGNDPDGAQRLLLAAPDLLKALYDLMTLAGDVNASEAWEEEMDAAQAAIDKATGQSS